MASAFVFLRSSSIFLCNSVPNKTFKLHAGPGLLSKLPPTVFPFRGQASSPMPAKVTPASFIPDYQEWYIPLTRRVLIEELITSGEYGASESDVRRLRLLAAELDIAVSIKYHNVLHDLKRFYDPVNPDKEANITGAFHD